MIEKAYGASVVGKGHLKRNLPNQDSFIIDNYLDYVLVVVSDGVGSKSYPKYGSKTLCNTIKEVTRNSMKLNKIKTKEDIYLYLDKIKKEWKRNLNPFKSDECSCTCLLAIITKTNIITCQMGDGLIAVQKDNSVISVDLKNDSFSNVTKTFSTGKFSDWKINIINKEMSKYKILLCSDGISEDLKDGVINNFINLISSNITYKKDKSKNNIALKNILNSWPNQYGLDDKTIVMVK